MKVCIYDSNLERAMKFSFAFRKELNIGVENIAETGVFIQEKNEKEFATTYPGGCIILVHGSELADLEELTDDSNLRILYVVYGGSIYSESIKLKNDNYVGLQQLIDDNTSQSVFNEVVVSINNELILRTKIQPSNFNYSVTIHEPPSIY